MGEIVKNSLGFNSDLYVYQDKDMFNYSVDTILLGNFVSLSKVTKHVLEIGTNNGALAIFLSARNPSMKIDAVEIQGEAIVLAKNNIELNNISNINLIHDDFRKMVLKRNKMQEKKYDGIICNPPFYKIDSSIKRKGSDLLYNATHEVNMTLEDMVKYSAKAIKQKGYLSVVIPTERLVDLFEYMRKYGFEPKRVQMIHPRPNQKANLTLVEGRFSVGWGTHFLPNIYLHPDDISLHEYTPEVVNLYKPIKVKGEK